MVISKGLLSTSGVSITKYVTENYVCTNSFILTVMKVVNNNNQYKCSLKDL